MKPSEFTPLTALVRSSSLAFNPHPWPCLRGSSPPIAFFLVAFMKCTFRAGGYYDVQNGVQPRLGRSSIHLAIGQAPTWLEWKDRRLLISPLLLASRFDLSTNMMHYSTHFYQLLNCALINLSSSCGRPSVPNFPMYSRFSNTLCDGTWIVHMGNSHLFFSRFPNPRRPRSCPSSF